VSFGDSIRGLVDDGIPWAFLTAAAFVLLLTPVVARIAPRIGGVDYGGDRPRVHTRPVPRIGGVAIVIAILAAAAIWVDLDGPYTGMLIGTGLVALAGLYDDIRGLRPSTKLATVMLVALIPVLGWDLRIEHVTLPFLGDHDIGWASVPLTLLWVAFLANLVNLIDGMDALAAGIVAIASGSFALLAVSFGRADAAVLAAIVCGATLGFLRHNYHPAKIFMGDSGALALGFLLALIAVEGVLKTAATIALAGPLLVMAVPILDTSFVVLKRLKYRRPPWSADHNHFYHRFMRIGFSQRRTAAYLHLWAVMLSAYAILVRFVPPRPQGEWDSGAVLLLSILGVLVLAASVWMAYTLEILNARHLPPSSAGPQGRGAPAARTSRPTSARRSAARDRGGSSSGLRGRGARPHPRADPRKSTRPVFRGRPPRDSSCRRRTPARPPAPRGYARPARAPARWCARDEASSGRRAARPCA
jgi:UDP-GlcNAc:undecaprenyl-phosphate/decaprenyl-phosphate GlcNAc-1-phosphate transferase